MLLALDIGNTNVVGGVFKPGLKDGRGVLARTWRFSTDLSKTPDEYKALLNTLFQQSGIHPKAIQGLIIASVVPPLTQVLQGAASELCGRRAMLVGTHLDLGLKVLTQIPEEVGVDRLANVLTKDQISQAQKLAEDRKGGGHE